MASTPQYWASINGGPAHAFYNRIDCISNFVFFIDLPIKYTPYVICLITYMYILLTKSSLLINLVENEC